MKENISDGFNYLHAWHPFNGCNSPFLRTAAPLGRDDSRVAPGNAAICLSARGFPAPQPRRSNIGAVTDRLELEPDHRLDHPFPPGEGSEAAIGRGDNALTIADRRHGLLDAACDYFRVLDEVAGGLDHAGDEDHVLGE